MTARTAVRIAAMTSDPQVEALLARLQVELDRKPEPLVFKSKPGVAHDVKDLFGERTCSCGGGEGCPA
jgi:hypothetical protein